MIQFDPRLETHNVVDFLYSTLQSSGSARASEDFRKRVGQQATSRQMSLTMLKVRDPKK
jgi:hypothetical protein